ncbi:MAG: S8 family peptidase [Acidimicrobiales bacterium]
MRHPHRWLASVALVAATVFALPAATASPAPLPLLGRFIVTLDSSVTDVEATALEQLGGVGQLDQVFTHAINGYSASLTQAALTLLLGDSRVVAVEAETVVHTQVTQSPTPSWGLDRIDQRNRPTNNAYTYTATGAGVNAYIVDTGLDLDHPDFGARAVSGFDAIDGGAADDCNGHGTHVAGTVGGTSYGVAKGVTLVAVRVLNCQGSGTNTQVINGINWAIQDHQAGQPAVANFSLGGGASAALDTAIRNLVADGVSVSVAAGNDTANSCSYSPARVAEAITVGASDQNDARASFSNGGTCVDLFAPGVSITSAWLNGGTNTISGTSMATPHVVGVAAQYLQNHRGATPAQTAQALSDLSTKNIVTGASFRSCFLLIFCSTVNTPNNHLLFTNL